jgi:TPR repeat protein
MRDAAVAGNSLAMERLGVQLMQGGCESPGHEEGVSWLRRSAAAGNPVAMYRLADHLLFTDAQSRSSEAQHLLERAAAADFLPAQVALGAYLLEGNPSANDSLALEMLRDAAKRGSSLAHVVLGVSFISGRGVTVDRGAGTGWLRRLGATKARLIGALASYLYSRALGSFPAERRRLTRFSAVLFWESICQGNVDDEVNLAYLIRRGEVSGEGFPTLDELLKRQLAAGTAHALMNQALSLARGGNRAADWRAADALVARLGDSTTLLSWWQSRASEGDSEGHLVLGWLVRHRHAHDPERLTMAMRFDTARMGGWQVPDWIYGNVSPATLKEI